MTPEEQAVKIEALEKAIDEIKQKDKDFRREVYDRLRECETKQARTDEKYNSIMETLKQQGKQLSDIVETLDDLRSRPAKRWESVVETIVTGIVMAFVGVVLGKGL